MSPPLEQSTAPGRGVVQAPVLTVRGLSKRFPGALAVDAVDLDILGGELHGLIGRNGAGKSVLVSMMAGLIPPSDGRIELRGESVAARRYDPIRARAAGVVLIPQEPAFAGQLSVTDNLFMGVAPAHRLGWLWPRSRAKRAADIIASLDLDGVGPNTRMADVPIESQQLLAFARAVYIDHARIILLDEITASLSQARKQSLLRLLRALLAETPELSFVLISHHIAEVQEFCDRVSVMRDGRHVAQLDVAETTGAVLAGWIVGDGDITGGEDSERAATSSTGPSRTLLCVQDLTLRGARLSPLSFQLGAGEVLGFAGLDGSGKEQAMRALFGLEDVAGGDVRLHDAPLTIDSPRAALRQGIAYLAKHREAEMIVQNMSVADNTLLSGYGRFLHRGGFVDARPARQAATRLTKAIGVKTPSLATPIDVLSGGNKQKVLINRLALAQPSVFLLNEPTRGVDIASKPALLATVRERLSDHTGVIVISESEDELISVCDRILVFFKGDVVSTLTRGTEAFSVDRLYKIIQGVIDA